MRGRVSLSVGLCLFLAGSAWAQLGSQTSLVGIVTDSGGHVVPDARVVATNAGTKDTYETKTNREGHYNIPFVRAGRYEISVSASGFRAWKAENVQVPTNQTVRTNATLQVGDVT